VERTDRATEAPTPSRSRFGYTLERLNIYVTTPDLIANRFSEEGYAKSVRLRIILEHDPVAESYSAVCPELPGCTSAGDTEARPVGTSRKLFASI
jgi:hypothetical protein